MFRRNYIKTVFGLIAGGAVMPRLMAAGTPLKAPEPDFKEGEKFPLKQVDPQLADELRMIGGVLQKYRMPAPVKPSGSVRVSFYDLFDANITQGSRTPVLINSRIGQIAVARRLNAPEFAVRQRFAPVVGGGVTEEVSASVNCNVDEIFSVREYETVWASSATALPFVRREAGAGKPALPLTVSWILMDAAGALPANEKIYRFDMLSDMTSLRRNQQLQFVRNETVPAADMQIPVKLFMQTGAGIPPIHYAVDEFNRTLFVTQGVLSWALNRIEYI